MYNLRATLKLVKPVQQVSEKFRKREFVVTDNASQYTQYITFQATQDKCDLLNGLNEGDEVEVGFYLRGREWKDNRSGEMKYFNSLEAYKIQKTGGQAAPAPGFEAGEPVDYGQGTDESDDLPF